jgi:hypothetical protein
VYYFRRIQDLRPLEIIIYNRQQKISDKKKKSYVGYTSVFTPGQRGAVSEAAKVPPFYVRDQRGGQQWLRLQARELDDAKAEAEKMQHVLQAKAKGVEVLDPTDENKERLPVTHYNSLIFRTRRTSERRTERHGADAVGLNSLARNNPQV